MVTCFYFLAMDGSPKPYSRSQRALGVTWALSIGGTTWTSDGKGSPSLGGFILIRHNNFTTRFTETRKKKLGQFAA